ncbi:hypothetical protein FBALC1_15672 [Flavobacteriales bacterium ALC-1]|nr:hypothetical protein FBALC1_15672 [Flavobacteriales bacterium ALC-1]
MSYGSIDFSYRFQADSLNEKEADSLFKLAQHLITVERKYEEGKRLFIKTDSIYQKLKIYDKVIASKVNTSVCLFLLWQPPEIQKVPIEQAFEYVQYLGDDHIDVARLYDHYSRYKYKAQAFEDAKYFKLKAFKIFNYLRHDQEPGIQKERFNNLLNLASIEQKLFNYDKAEELYLNGLNIAKENQYDTATIYSSLLNLYLVDEKYNKLEKLLQKEGIKSYSKEDTPLFDVFGIESTKASYYTITKQYDLALKTLLDFQEFVATSNYNKHISDEFIKRRLSHVYYDMGNYEKVINLLVSVDINDKNWINRFNSDRLKILAQSYYNIGKTKKSISMITEAIALNFDTQNSPADFHSEVEINKAKFKNLALLKALTVKGDLSKQIYESTTDEDYLNIAMNSYQNVHELIKIIGSLSEEDKFMSNEEFKSFYESLLDLYHHNWQSTQDSNTFFKALSVCDESKNVTILSEIKSIKQSQLQKSIPKKILKKEEALLKFLDSVQSIFHSRSHIKLEILKDSVEQEFDRFKKKLKIVAPNYYDVRYGNGKPIEQQIKTRFKNDNLIEFFFGNKAIYIFNVNGELLQFDKITITDSLKYNINTVVRSLQNRNAKMFKKSSIIIYKRLFEKYIDLNKKNKVILDGELHLLPIESLWVPSKEGSHFLIEDISVVRLNSITQNFTSQIGQTKTLLFAPFATHDGFNKTKLSSSKYEVNRINEILNGNVYLDEKANKDKFVEDASNARLIHLATHSSINKEAPLNSKIYFYDNSNLEPSQKYLKLEELYALKLNSDLVTLSACETGIGKEVKGKGVISLSNAFAFSGVKSTVMSLWKVPDQETSILMVSFYENLNKGQDKDEALRNAKLHYLKSTDDEMLKHPFYWSGFVISGDVSAIETQSNNIIIVLGILLLLVLIFLGRKRLIKLFK